MRLLLDEHFAPEIASSLRQRDHDVVAVTERLELRHRADIDILVAASAEGRVVVTEDAKDFLPLGARRLPDKRPHVGVVLVPRRSFPRSRRGFGRIIRALDAFLRAHPGDEDLVGDVIWLTRASADPD